jgi:hypothetical protein
LAPETPLLPRCSSLTMPPLLARLSEPLPAMFSCISNCSAELMPAASICSLLKEVIGSDSSASARRMREPVTVTWSRVFIAGVSAVVLASWAWTATGAASATSKAAQRRWTTGVVLAGMQGSPVGDANRRPCSSGLSVAPHPQDATQGHRVTGL